MPRMDSTIAALSKLPSSKVSVPVSRLDILLCPLDLLNYNQNINDENRSHQWLRSI